MCLMLYIGSHQGVPERAAPDLRVEPVENGRKGVIRWFTQPVVQFVGAHTGCSCGFPSVVAESVIEYYDGMWADSDDRTDDLRSVSALIQLLPAALDAGQPVELYPVWDGNEGVAPKGAIQWSLNQLAPATFFFNEQFMHVVSPSAVGYAIAHRRP
jgi:hypothetical protein